MDGGQAATLDAVAAGIAAVSPQWQAAVRPDHGTATSSSFGLEAIREGWLIHRDSSRLLSAGDPGLGLLIGDWCYAAGLCAIAEHGTLDDVAALARLIADVSVACEAPIDALDERWEHAAGTLSTHSANSARSSEDGATPHTYRHS